MVLTCFDELQESKGIVLVRGDIISHLDEDEGYTIMAQTLNGYMQDHKYDTIHNFNNRPDSFEYESYISQALIDFAEQKKHYVENKKDKIELGKQKKWGHLTDKQMGITTGRGGILRWVAIIL